MLRPSQPILRLTKEQGEICTCREIPEVKIVAGDTTEVLARLGANSVGSIVTDPPYGLEFMGLPWDRLALPVAGNLGGFADGRKPSFERVKKHLPTMQDWHAAWAKAAIRLLKPGGYLVAMSSTRTFHHLALALEAAGFEIRDCLCWIYASGFPKSLDLAKAVAKETGEFRLGGKETLTDIRGGQMHAGRDTKATYERAVLCPAGVAAKWAGWGTALKPAWEPILVARRPLYERNVARNALALGTGGINIDGCRIPYEGQPDCANNWYRKDAYASARKSLFQGKEHSVRRGPAAGRFPANVVCDNADANGPLPGVVVGGRGISNTASRGAPIHRKSPKTQGTYGHYRMRGTDYPGNPPETNLGDGILGQYTRFFRLPIYEPTSPRLFVVPKPSKRERGPGNDHPTVKPVSLFRHLIRLVTPPGETVCDPFMGSGTTAVSAIYEGVPFLGIERRKAYVRIAERRVRDALRQLRSQTRIGF